jgi:hypothetical protein
MRISVGIDIAKETHWVIAIDADGGGHIDRKLENTPAAIASLIDELKQLGGSVRIGLDVVGGIAGLAEAMLAEAGFALVHVPGLAVNRARQGTVGGEHKSDPRDARVIAEQVRIRQDLRPIEPASELDLELRLLAGWRRDLVDGQTQRLSRLHDLLASIFPGLERGLDLTTKGPLVLLTNFVTPAEMRAAGKRRLIRHLKAAGGLPNIEALADRALAAAAEQTIAIPAERMSARLIKELASEALATRSRLASLDRELEALLARHPDAALIRSLPAWGPCSPPSSSPRQAASRASAPPTRSPPRPALPRSCASPARSASCAAPQAATRGSSASSTSPPSAPLAIPTAASSTTASGARENAITRPSSPSRADGSTSSGPSSTAGSPSNQTSNLPLDAPIRLHAAGIRSLVAELADQETPALAAFEPLLKTRMIAGVTGRPVCSPRVRIFDAVGKSAPHP